MRTISAALLAAAACASTLKSATCSALNANDTEMLQFDKKVDSALSQDDDTHYNQELAQVSAAANGHVKLPTHNNLGAKMILDKDQNALLPRKRVIWNGDLTSVNQGPPLAGATALSGWRFFWAGVKNSDIAIEKEQLRRKDGKLFIEHWDHVMTFPAACEHAMQVMNTHFAQVKVNQNDLEARLAVMDRMYGEEKAKAVVHKKHAAIRKLKAKIIKKKVKLVIAALKCTAAKRKQAAHVAKK